jgi:hypothetical protein
MDTNVMSENLKGRDHAEHRRRWEDNIIMDVRESFGRCELDSSGSG